MVYHLPFYLDKHLNYIDKMGGGYMPHRWGDPRSPEDQRSFEVTLPNMGSLYSMFDVMVCEEVTEDTAPYESSGWCSRNP